METNNTNLIYTLIIQCKYTVMKGIELYNSHYSQYINDIDFLIITDKLIVTILDTSNSTKFNKINNFIKVSKLISNNENKICICIHLGKIFDIINNNIHNLNYPNQYIHIIVSSTKSNLIKQLTKVLYEQQIFFYDSNDTAIMFE